jgi:hypothetical protein
MTERHSPITPPTELMQQWTSKWSELRPSLTSLDEWLATQAARWGSDQELEACCLWMERNFDDWDNRFSDELRAARRPKPPSLKEQALADLDTLVGRGRSSDTIRRALEQLPDQATSENV